MKSCCILHGRVFVMNMDKKWEQLPYLGLIIEVRGDQTEIQADSAEIERYCSLQNVLKTITKILPRELERMVYPEYRISGYRLHGV